MHTLGLRRTERELPDCGSSDENLVVCWDFTVDGTSIGDLNGWEHNVTALGGLEDDFALENLRRLLGDSVPVPSFETKWAREPKRFLGIQVRAGIPCAAMHSVFPDGRIGRPRDRGGGEVFLMRPAGIAGMVGQSSS